jgi:hypothetical protein
VGAWLARDCVLTANHKYPLCLKKHNDTNAALTHLGLTMHNTFRQLTSNLDLKNSWGSYSPFGFTGGYYYSRVQYAF